METQNHTKGLKVLTERERELSELIAFDFSNKQIADKLFISIDTCKTHIKNIRKKLSVNSRVGIAVKIALAMPQKYATAFLVMLLGFGTFAPSLDLVRARRTRKSVRVSRTARRARTTKTYLV